MIKKTEKTKEKRTTILSYQRTVKRRISQAYGREKENEAKSHQDQVTGGQQKKKEKTKIKEYKEG